ncbi:MAG TPA: hypothetical protein VFQ16_08880 [Burkholderiaceae bacterium]|nr:hypothetical protein [Burkholderiaceae bacterium]
MCACTSGGRSARRTVGLGCVLRSAAALGLAVLTTVVSAATALRPLPADFGARQAVAYSPYRTARNVAERDHEAITEAMVRQDLELLRDSGFTLIRLFDSSDKVARLTLQVIRERRLDVKVMLGIYVQHDAPAYNEAEIARGIALAREYRDSVVAVSVGNETMVSWSFNRFDTAAMSSFIERVRAAVEQPVTTDDNWAFFAHDGPREQDPSPVLARIDFVAMHTYPVLDSVYSPHLWDWRQAGVPPARRALAMVDAAVARAKAEYAAVRARLDALGLQAMPIVIGETGWQADPAMVPFRSHPVNQQLYVERMWAWQASGQGPRTIFLFEAFDEPWKEADDKWGLFDVQRRARCVLRARVPAALWAPEDCAPERAAYVTPLVIRRTVTAPRTTAWAGGARRGAAAATWTSPEGGAVVRAGRSARIDPPAREGRWSVMLQVPDDRADDLSAFAGGRLEFRLRTREARPFEIGFHVGSASEGSALRAWVSVADGQHGHRADGAWHRVSIPIASLRQAVAEREKVGLTRIDLQRVTAPFVIAARRGAGDGPPRPIEIDDVHWVR